MAKSKRRSGGQNNLETVESTLSRTERFIEENQKYFMSGLVILLILVVGIIGYVRFIRNPHIAEAWEESYKAEFYFERDSFSLALYGDGFFPGFLDIIDDYGRTPAGNAARYYAGVCYMRLGDYDEAIRHLDRFKSSDPMVGAMAIAIHGDALVELGNPEKGLEKYLEAEKHASNEFLSPNFIMKAAAIYEELGDFEAALDLYKRIKTEYHGSSEQQEIEKYIQRAKILSGKL